MFIGAYFHERTIAAVSPACAGPNLPFQKENSMDHLLDLDRRRLVLGGGLLAAASFAPSIAWSKALGGNPFTLGVAAGDPWPDGFVIWTRLALKPLDENGGMAMTSYPVRYELSSDDQFRTIVRSGETLARPEMGHSVHVELTGLQPARPYWYRFFAGNDMSAQGIARTAPALGAAVPRVRIGVAGCQNYEQGLFTAYRHLAREDDVDAVFHYGDYIYEGRSRDGLLRRHAGDEIYTISDYRRRYAQYKMDDNLQAAHAAAAFIMSFDDHEVDNNWAGDADQDGTPPEYFAYRRAAAMQAWYENLPVRRSQLPRAQQVQMYRRLEYGRTLRMHVLDTRQYRTKQICAPDRPKNNNCLDQPLNSGSILGAAQEKWLGDGLSAQHSWNLLAQQVMVMPLTYPEHRAAGRTNMDSWSGYPSSRKKLVQQIEQRKLTNVVIATGDVHAHHAGYVPSQEGDVTSRPAAAEFVTTSISSGGNGQSGFQRWGNMDSENPNCQLNLDQRGYQLLDFHTDHMTAQLRVVDRVDQADGALSTAAAYHLPNKKVEISKIG